MRISAHELSIEAGRYKGVFRENRICESCYSGDIEDEEHFLLHCSKFSAKRDDFFNELTKVHHNFNSLSNLEKIKIILNDPANCQLSARYIAEIYEERSQYKS